MANSWVSYVTDQAPPITQAEKENNVAIIWDILGSLGYTAEAVAAIAGNMEYEGFLNPGQYEIGYNYSLSGGGGLCGWTPIYYTGSIVAEQNRHLKNCCDSWGINWLDGDSQLRYLNYEMTDWYGLDRLQFDTNPLAPSLGYPLLSPLTAQQFIVSTISVTDLAAYWELYYERPYDPGATISYRQSSATFWYNYIQTLPPPTPPVPPTPARRKMPIWMMCRRNKTIRRF